jgi:hypothetical protein
VTDLQTLTRLQARVFEFLAQQDESTLHQLADGALQLTVTDGEGSVAPRRTQVPRADDPIEVARELQRISAPQDRAYYLDTLGASVKTLKGVAKILGLRRYSDLTLIRLKEMLADPGGAQLPRRGPGVQRQTPLPATAYGQAPPPAATPPVDGDAIAAQLRQFATEDEGGTHLHALGLDVDGLRAVAGALGMSRVESLTAVELEKRILKQAIGARNKFAVLRRR